MLTVGAKNNSQILRVAFSTTASSTKEEVSTECSIQFRNRLMMAIILTVEAEASGGSNDRILGGLSAEPGQITW